MNDRSPQNAYSISSFKSLPKDSSEFSTEQIVNVLNEYSIALSLISEDKELLQRFKTALGRTNGLTPKEHLKQYAKS